MSHKLQEALEFANYRHSFSIKHQELKEQAEQKLTYGYNGGIFKIDMSLISFINIVIQANRTERQIVLDANQNPVLIDNVIQFYDEILDRYFSVTNEYYNQFQQMKKQRSVEKLINDE